MAKTAQYNAELHYGVQWAWGKYSSAYQGHYKGNGSASWPECEFCANDTPGEHSRYGFLDFVGLGAAVKGKNITKITVGFQFTAAGNVAPKTIKFWPTTAQSIDKSITPPSYIGATPLGTYTTKGNAYNAGEWGVELTEGELFNNLKSYLQKGNSILCIYNGEDYNDTSSNNGYCSANYLQISSCGMIVEYVQSYNITFDANGGNCSTTSKTVNYSETYGTLPTATRTGYTFDGWFTSKTGGTEITSSTTVSQTTAHTLYAHWTANTYYVKFDSNSGSGSMSNQSHTYGSSKALISNKFTKTGYTFSGWATSAGGSVKYTNGQSVSNLTTTNGGTFTLYAVWVPNTYYVKFNSNGGYGSKANQEFTYDTTESLDSNVFTRTGYNFAGWATTSSGSVTYRDKASVKNLTSTAGDIVNLYAVWDIIIYTITYNANGGVDSSVPSSQSKRYGETLKLSNITPIKNSTTLGNYSITLDANGGECNTSRISGEQRTDYSFKNWNDAESGNGNSYNKGASFSANSNTTLYAQWNSKTFTESVKLPVATRDGFIFMGWATSANASSGKTGSYTPTNHEETLYAVWMVDPGISRSYIHDGTSWRECIIYIDDGTEFKKYRAYIDKVEGWTSCG